jgi:hypothetical protein
MKLNLPFLLLFCLSCATAHPTPNFISGHGFYVYTNGYDLKTAEFDAVVNETILALVRRNIFTYQEIEKALRSAPRYEVKIRIPVPCLHSNGEKYLAFEWNTICCQGLWRWDGLNGKIDLLHEECIGNSSLPHELFHFFGWHINKKEDLFHFDTKKFLQGCLVKYPKPKSKDIQDNHYYDRYLCYKNTLENELANILIDKFCSSNPLSSGVHIYHLWQEKDVLNE